MSEDQTIQVDFRCGYGENPQDIPQPLKQAILNLVMHFYENRDAQLSRTFSLPYPIRNLADPYRILHLV